MNNELENTLPNSLGTELTTVGSNIFELGVDAVLNDGILKNIPVVNSIVGLFKAGLGIKDYYYIEKLLKFLMEFKNIDESLRLKFISEELSDDSKRKKFGEVMLTLIDKNDDAKKFKLYARVFELHILDHCSYDDAIRLCTMIDRTIMDP